MLYNRKQAHVSMARLAQANTHGHQPYAYATSAPAAAEMDQPYAYATPAPAAAEMVVVQGTYAEPPAERPGVLPGTYLRS